MKEGYTVIKLLPDQTGPREVGVSFELDGHGWKILEQSRQWKNLVKLLEDLQRESQAADHQDREQSEERTSNKCHEFLQRNGAAVEQREIRNDKGNILRTLCSLFRLW